MLHFRSKNGLVGQGWLISLSFTVSFIKLTPSESDSVAMVAQPGQNRPSSNETSSLLIPTPGGTRKDINAIISPKCMVPSKIATSYKIHIKTRNLIK